MTCPVCGTSFLRQPSNGGRFCSRSCALTWRWNHSPDREKHRRNAAERTRKSSPRPSPEVLHDLYVIQELPTSQIAEMYTVQAQTVCKWLHADGVSVRPSPPPRTKAKYAPPPEHELRQMYETQRMTTVAIGEQLGVSGGLVLQWLKRYGITARPSGTGLAMRGIDGPTPDELSRMIHDERLTYSQIAARYGVDQSAIQHWLRRHGIERPPTWFDQHNKPETVEAMRQAYDAGASLEDIGQHWGGVTRTMVKVLFETHGIQLRPGGWKGGQRFECKDGHMVRSTYEQRVDNWLHEHGIEHIYEPPLPFSPVHRSDFLANGWFIEVWGVTHNEKYQERKQRKIALYESHHAPLIELPTHSFSAANNNLWVRRLHQCLVHP